MRNFTDDSDKSNSNLENVKHAFIGLAPYLGRSERWTNFKKIWFEEDNANLESILKKVKINGNYSAYLDQQLSPHSSKFRISTRLNLSFGYEVDRYWFLFGMEARRDYSHFSKPPSYDRFKEAE